MLNYLDEERRGAKHEFMHNGDKMSQREFSKIYSKLPEPYKAELIAGIVYEPPPPTLSHSVGDLDLSALLRHYTAYTPGTDERNPASTTTPFSSATSDPASQETDGRTPTAVMTQPAASHEPSASASPPSSTEDTAV